MSSTPYPTTPKFYCKVPVAPDYAVEIMRTDSGREQRVLLGTAEIRAYHLEYPLLTDAEAAALKSHFDAHKGSWDSFPFSAPAPGGSESKQVRFAPGGFRLQHEFNAASGRMWSCSVDLEVVL